MNQLLSQPRFRGFSHQIMFFVSIFASISLVVKSTNKLELVATITYSFGLLSMFGFSALYHRKNLTTEKKKLLRKFDHGAIFLMLAGTFTPICLLVLPIESGIKLLTAVWLASVIGILVFVLSESTPRLIRAFIFLLIGYFIFPFMPAVILALNAQEIVLLLSGGIVYSLGAVAYGIRFPVLSPEIFGFHEFFHLLVIVAATLHFFLIFGLI
jgi:hemolysin III